MTCMPEKGLFWQDTHPMAPTGHQAAAAVRLPNVLNRSRLNMFFMKAGPKS